MPASSPPPSSPPSKSLLWYPGSTSYPCPARQAMDPSQSMLQLQKLYEELSEGFYDLSLTEIVDPSYSISGNLKAGSESPVTSADCHSSGKSSCLSSLSSSSSKKSEMKLMSRWRTPYLANDRQMVSSGPKSTLAFSFSFPGMNNIRNPPGTTRLGSRGSLGRNGYSDSNLFKHPTAFQPCFPSSQRLPIVTSKQQLIVKQTKEVNQHQVAAFNVPPSNKCSFCSSYTIFFKSECSLCGKLYCSNCAKDAMEVVPHGIKCKGPCDNRLLVKWFSVKTMKFCWPFCINTDVEDVQFKHIRAEAAS